MAAESFNLEYVKEATTSGNDVKVGSSNSHDVKVATEEEKCFISTVDDPCNQGPDTTKGCRPVCKTPSVATCVIVIIFIAVISTFISLSLTYKRTLVSHPLFDGCTKYPTYEQIYQILQKLGHEFDQNIELETIGRSFEKRNLTLARLSSNFEEDKPKMWIQCGAHGRETSTPIVCLSLIYNFAILLQNKSNKTKPHQKPSDGTCIFETESWEPTHNLDGALKFSINESIIDEFEFMILPLVNPDGYEFALYQPEDQDLNLIEPELVGFCVTSDGEDQNNGVTTLKSSSKDDCYRKCRAIPQATGCEWQTSNACAFHTLDVAAGNGNNSYRCWVFNTSQTDGDPSWRKNRNNSTNNHCSKLIGVDLNRNYDVEFYRDVDKRKKPCSNGYGGEKPFSESETRAISDKLESYKGAIAGALDIHSFMGAWLYPPSYKLQDTNHSLTTKKILSRISAVTGVEYVEGSGPSLTYFCSGTFMDWVFEVLGCHHAYTLELRSPMGSFDEYMKQVIKEGFYESEAWKFFQPEFRTIQPVTDETWIGVLALMEQLGDSYSQNSGLSNE